MNLLHRDFIVREPLLVGILVLITVLLSALTHSYSQAYDRRRTALSVEWLERGKTDLQNKHATSAVEDFRTALFYDPRNLDTRLHLADALMQANQTDQALNYYSSIWQTMPSNGSVNLQLARLYAQKGEAAAAERHFNGAVFGDWPDNAPANRREALLELIHFYLDRGDTGHAESQLMILSDNLPHDATLHAEVGDMYSRVGDAQRALTQYREALNLDPNYLPAIQGAAKASFTIGDYHASEAYLDHALHIDESDTSAKKLSNIVQSIFSLNPYERGISEAEKIKRTLHAFAVVGERLQSCASTPGSPTSTVTSPSLERWTQLKAIANARFLTQHPEEIETLIDFSGSAEKLAQSHCGEPRPEDSALLAIAQLRQAENQ